MDIKIETNEAGHPPDQGVSELAAMVRGNKPRNAGLTKRIQAMAVGELYEIDEGEQRSVYQVAKQVGVKVKTAHVKSKLYLMRIA